ncbi:hypothetical protein ABB26_10150 [Stenotrophomonas humi]|uniref:Uncharacterized protein n=1 Tax=Stenotrophomonas humi TaxID=405444 RepID=A0A0R0CFS6_9GAMM|nr:hypothetical protein [Stenotrophomonas humi]KRG63928.1 hypothetical protein ABB26_10150 [Stenotrophomonas humi]
MLQFKVVNMRYIRRLRGRGMAQHFEGPCRLIAIRNGSGPYTATGYVHLGYEARVLAMVEASGEYSTQDEALAAGISAARAAARRMMDAAEGIA